MIKNSSSTDTNKWAELRGQICNYQYKIHGNHISKFCQKICFLYAVFSIKCRVKTGNLTDIGLKVIRILFSSYDVMLIKIILTYM